MRSTRNRCDRQGTSRHDVPGRQARHLAARLCRVALPKSGTHRASSSTMPRLAAIRPSSLAGLRFLPRKRIAGYRSIYKDRHSESEGRCATAWPTLPAPMYSVWSGRSLGSIATIAFEVTALERGSPSLYYASLGEVSEWLKEPVSKTGEVLRPSRVRIPPSPLSSFGRWAEVRARPLPNIQYPPGNIVIAQLIGQFVSCKEKSYEI